MNIGSAVILLFVVVAAIGATFMFAAAASTLKTDTYGNYADNKTMEVQGVVVNGTAGIGTAGGGVAIIVAIIILLTSIMGLGAYILGKNGGGNYGRTYR